MSLTCLKVTDFRNLRAIDIELCAGFNFFCGANGSGKTSLLEAVYFLTHGRSFRTQSISRIIHNEATVCTLFGSFVTADDHTTYAGIERQRNGHALVKINGQADASVINLINIQPVLLINPFTFQLLDAGPQYRRQFLDWGVFHVEHNFLPTWRRHQRALKQRNAALKKSDKMTDAKIWDAEFVATSLALHQFRKTYVEKLIAVFIKIITQLLCYPDLTINYQPGWDDDYDLQQLLDKAFIRDSLLGHTQYGPQKADVIIKCKHIPAVEVLSRGEQKLLVYALKLAQGILLQDTVNKTCLYLIDDLAAELDQTNQAILFQELINLQAQVLVTSVNSNSSGLLANVAQPTFYELVKGAINKENSSVHDKNYQSRHCEGA